MSGQLEGRGYVECCRQFSELGGTVIYMLVLEMAGATVRIAGAMEEMHLGHGEMTIIWK